jgi:hypothetical protein
VKVGDRVIIDYSAGIKPVVRPLFAPEYSTPELNPAEVFEVFTPLSLEHSCGVVAQYDAGYGYTKEGVPVGPGGNPEDGFDHGFGQVIEGAAETPIIWADNELPGWGWTCEVYDVAAGADGMYDENEHWGSTQLVIRRSGRYIIYFMMMWDALNGQGEGDPDYDQPTQLEGVVWSAITKNGEIVAKISNRTWENGGYTFSGDDVYQKVVAIEQCVVGDIISTLVYEDNEIPYHFPEFLFPNGGDEGSDTGLRVHFIPGTEF